jgi:hypothetical protein
MKTEKMEEYLKNYKKETGISNSDVETLVIDANATLAEAVDSLWETVEHKGLHLSRKEIEEIVNNHATEILDTYMTEMTDKMCSDVYAHLLNEVLNVILVRDDYEDVHIKLVNQGLEQRVANHIITRLGEYSDSH